MLIQLAVSPAHVKIRGTVENAVTHALTNPLDQLGVL